MAAPAAYFAITAMFHTDCDGCREAAESAAVMARVTGSRGATHEARRTTPDGASAISHSATVKRSLGVVTL